MGRQLVNTFVPHGTAPAFTADLATIENMRRTMRPVVSDLFTSLVAKRPVYNVSIPIAGDTGLRYVMSFGLVSGRLRRLLHDQHLEAGWTTEIWDRKGVILAHSREQERRLGKTVPDRWREQPLGRVVRTGASTANACWRLRASRHWPAGPYASPFPRGWSTPRPASSCGCGERRRCW